MIAAVLSLLFIGAVCWSRVYLGVHWLTDVTAVAALGALWLFAVILARESVLGARHLGMGAPLRTRGPSK